MLANDARKKKKMKEDKSKEKTNVSLKKGEDKCFSGMHSNMYFDK